MPGSGRGGLGEVISDHVVPQAALVISQIKTRLLSSLWRKKKSDRDIASLPEQISGISPLFKALIEELWSWISRPNSISKQTKVL